MGKELLFVVKEVFIIKERGVFLAPGITSLQKIKSNDMVELQKPDGTYVKCVVQGVEIMNYQLGIPMESQTHPIILAIEVTDVPTGTEVWKVSS